MLDVTGISVIFFFLQNGTKVIKVECYCRPIAVLNSIRNLP
jgi:hypothetical protein